MSKLDDVIANQEYVIDCLKALRNIHQAGCCNDCAVRKCQYAPKPGQIVRYNCVFYEKQAAIDAAKHAWAKGLEPSQYIEIIPPAQPEPHEGHWILRESYYGDEQYECSQCGVIWEFSDGTPKENDSYYCPHCGAKMKGVIHETD